MREWPYLSFSSYSGKSWSEYWDLCSKPGEWVDYIFIQVTACFLIRDIIIVTTSSTLDHPFILISGDRSEDEKADGPAIIIGMKTNIHFQSLLSVGQELPLRCPDIPNNPISLTLEHLGLTKQYLTKSKKINNFVEAVEAATDIKKENLAIEQEQAINQSEKGLKTWSRVKWLLKMTLPWVGLLGMMGILGYAMVASNERVAKK